jgi:hypothetical protein
MDQSTKDLAEACEAGFRSYQLLEATRVRGQNRVGDATQDDAVTITDDVQRELLPYRERDLAAGTQLLSHQTEQDLLLAQQRENIGVDDPAAWQEEKRLRSPHGVEVEAGATGRYGGGVRGRAMHAHCAWIGSSPLSAEDRPGSPPTY